MKPPMADLSQRVDGKKPKVLGRAAGRDEGSCCLFVGAPSQPTRPYAPGERRPTVPGRSRIRTQPRQDLMHLGDGAQESAAAIAPARGERQDLMHHWNDTQRPGAAIAPARGERQDLMHHWNDTQGPAAAVASARGERQDLMHHGNGAQASAAAVAPARGERQDLMHRGNGVQGSATARSRLRSAASHSRSSACVHHVLRHATSSLPQRNETSVRRRGRQAPSNRPPRHNLPSAASCWPAPFRRPTHQRRWMAASRETTQRAPPTSRAALTPMGRRPAMPSYSHP